MPSSAPARRVRGCFGWIANPNTRLSAQSPARTWRQLSPPSGLTHAPVPTVPAQIVKLSAIAVSSRKFHLARRRFPAGVGNVYYDPVGTGPFHLEIAVTTGCHFHIETRLLLEPLAVGALQLRRGSVEILHFKAEMMDPAVIGPAGADIGGFLRLPIEDRQIDVAVGEEDGAVRGSPDFLHSEGILVEGRDFGRLLRRQRDMLYAGHRFSSSCV